MANIFKYVDFRKFLQERFLWLKKNRRGVTHRSLCKKGGFNSPNFLKLVMDGKRNLSEQSLSGVCQAFELEGKEVEFFKTLVLFNQAKKVGAKDKAYENLKSLRRDLSNQHMGHGQMDYLEKWHHVAIRELVETTDFQENPEWISEKLKKKISPSQAKKSLEMLEKLGLIQRDEKGKIKSKQAALTTGNEVASLAAFRYHRDMIQKALEALQEAKAHEREISSLTISVSQELFLEIQERIRNFRKEILALANENEKADSIYQLNFQLFNLTETLWDKSSKS